MLADLASHRREHRHPDIAKHHVTFNNPYPQLRFHIFDKCRRKSRHIACKCEDIYDDPMGDAKASGGKREKFVKLAESRTANAIRAIRVIGNLSNRAHYESTDSDVRKIVAALNGEVDALKRRFTEPTSRSLVNFKL